MKLKKKVTAYLGIQVLFPKILSSICIKKNTIQMESCNLKWLFGRQMNLLFKATLSLMMITQKTEEEEAWLS
jgi:hypothetical protein